MIQYSDLDATNCFWYTQIWKPGTRLNYLDRGEQGGFQDSNRLRLISRFKQLLIPTSSHYKNGPIINKHVDIQ